MLKKIAVGVTAAAAFALITAPAASAAPHMNVYGSIQECNEAGGLYVISKGGPQNAGYSCEPTNVAPAGSQLCPGQFDCLGNFFVLRRF